MKILLDENIDINFKEEFSEYDIQTVKDKSWEGIENGRLLKLLIKNNYDIFITLDSNLRYQQNLSNFKIHIIVLKAKDSRLSHLKLFTAKIKFIIDKLNSNNEFEVIEVSL